MAAQMRADPNYKKREATTFQTPNFYESLEREKRGETRDWALPFNLDEAVANRAALDAALNAKSPLEYEQKMREAVGFRDVDPEQYSHASSVRHSDKNQRGQSELSGSSQEKKDYAAHVFNVTPPADMSKEDPARIIGIVEIASKPIEWVPVPIHQAIWKKLTGHLVRWRKK